MKFLFKSDRLSLSMVSDTFYPQRVSSESMAETSSQELLKGEARETEEVMSTHFDLMTERTRSLELSIPKIEQNIT